MRGVAYPEAVAVDSAVARLNAIPEYVALFWDVYGPGSAIHARQLASAISAFERSLVAMPVRPRPGRRQHGHGCAGDPGLIAFLHALTDEDFDRAIPVRVPSGLPPGGAMSATR